MAMANFLFVGINWIAKILALQEKERGEFADFLRLQNFCARWHGENSRFFIMVRPSTRSHSTTKSKFHDKTCEGQGENELGRNIVGIPQQNQSRRPQLFLSLFSTWRLQEARFKENPTSGKCRSNSKKK